MSNVEIVIEDEPPDGQPLLGLSGVAWLAGNRPSVTCGSQIGRGRR